MLTFTNPTGSDADVALAAAQHGLRLCGCPENLITTFAPRLVPSLRVVENDISDPREPSCSLPWRRTIVVDPQGNPRFHGVRNNDPLTISELIVEKHNDPSPAWADLRWLPLDRSLFV